MNLEDKQENSGKEALDYTENLPEDSTNDSKKYSSNDADGQELQAQDVEPKNSETKDTETPSETQKQKLKKGETDKDINLELYNEVLEKLDIQKKDNNQDIQETQNESVLNQKKQVEGLITQDFLKIQKFVNAGLINSEEGQNLKKQVLKKAFDMLVQSEKKKRAELLSTTKNNVFDEFSKSNPDFFNSDGRKEVLAYLKSSDANVGKDELNKISEIIRIVEKTAIDRYLNKVNHEKTLRDSNEAAKQRLTANAQKTNFNSNLTRTFTREQIGKMSSAEFAKYESTIMEQLKKGRIK